MSKSESRSGRKSSLANNGNLGFAGITVTGKHRPQARRDQYASNQANEPSSANKRAWRLLFPTRPGAVSTLSTEETNELLQGKEIRFDPSCTPGFSHRCSDFCRMPGLACTYTLYCSQALDANCHQGTDEHLTWTLRVADCGAGFAFASEGTKR